MVIDIKMCRFDNVPWGFRLVGGADFEYPPTVVKVAEGSLAEEAGLRVGDVIVRVNDTPTSPLAHDELNKIITHCGNVFYFGVYREEPEEPETGPKHFPLIGVERPTTAESFLDVSSSCKSPNSGEGEGEDEYLRDMSDRPCSVLSENTEIKMVEEEIAAVLSGESEVLKEHNIMGVNFYRIFPKPGVCMSSDVLRTLNEEAIKTKAEKDKENKKWTTFLQKPNRPIPKSKAQIEAERRAANAYRVKIVKSAPRTPSRSVSPMPPPVPETRAKEEKKDEEESLQAKEPEIPPDEAPTPTDNEVPNLEEAPIVAIVAAAAAAADQRESTSEDGEEKIDCEKEARPETKETESENVQVDSKSSNDNNSNDSNNIGASQVNEPQVERTAQARQVDRSAEELALEGQLASVQKQLAALSSLPSTIQATLDAVTRQLADLLPTLKLQQVQPRDISLEQIDENAAEASDKDVATNKDRDRDHAADADADIDEDDNKMERNRERDREREREREQRANEDKQRTASSEQTQQREQQDPIKLMESAQSREDTREMEEEQSLKKQKRNDVIEELEEHLERKNNPKRSKRAFGPLTPSSERPLVLPGGRRWYRPKDAYNDEFIAETLSAQAELISGTTLGVNFMKYQKPERKIDLNRSEVYKVIHHLDRQPVRGIEVRPPMVAAEADVRKAVSS